MARVLILLLKIALSAGLIWYAFSRIDLASAWSTLQSIPASALISAMVLLSVQILLLVYRLKGILGYLGQSYRLSTALDTVWVGAFFSQTLISFVGGDAMRIWRMARSQVPIDIATKSVVLDRIAGFAGVVTVVLITIPFLLPVLESLEMRLGLLLIAGGALGTIAFVFVLRRLPESIRGGRGIGALFRFLSLGLEIVRSGRGAAYILGISILIQVANVLILFALARGLSLGLSLAACFLFMPTVLFLSMLPISIAGWGVREGAMVGALAVIGVPAHESLALSICFGLCLIFVSLPGGGIWFFSRGKVLPVEGQAQTPVLGNGKERST